ncbi:MAG: hypothetical protein IKP47_08405 [Ruminococcus sp.]|nr:hypothetical protein [Ruminococcus sp.]
MDDKRNDGAIANDDEIVSSDFDYDVYSGGSAMEYLRQQNEREREERERAKKTEGELRREEYEKRYAGMSADEIFGMPEKKKPKKEDFSDFFDDDAALREAERRAHPDPERGMPKVESMMPGEDSPSSAPSEEELRQQEGRAAAAELLAHERFRLEREKEAFERRRTGYSYGRYGHRSAERAFFGMATGRYNDNSDFNAEIEKAFWWYVLWFAAGVGLGFLIKASSGLKIILGGVMGAVGSFVRHNGIEKKSAAESFHSIVFELIGLGLAIIFGIVIEFM